MKPEPVVKIRPTRLADDVRLLSMMKLFNQSESIPWRPQRVRPALRRLLREPRLGVVLVAEIPGSALVGYVIATFNYDLEFAGSDAFVTELFVKPSRRGRGLGKTLLEAVTSAVHAASAKAIHLLVSPRNRVARSLYESSGFEAVPRLMMTRMLGTTRGPPKARNRR
jgi:ribosomal protein S18 acetylase RimI-like enzyme